MDGATTTDEHVGQDRRARVWPGRVLRVVSGLAVVAVVAASVAAATRVPAAPDVAVAPDRVAVPPAPSSLVCPGAPILPDDERTDAGYDAVPVQPVTSLAVLTAGSSDGPGSVAPVAGGDPVATLAAGGDAVALSPADAPVVATAQPGDAAARLAATGSALVTRGDLRGLVAASCVSPAADAWLVGGSTELSSTAQLVLLDAGTTPARVNVELWGPAGPVDTSSDQYLVAPGGRKVVLLGAVAPEQRRVVVHVSATGGTVAAYVQDSSLDGFTPTGTALVTPGSAPTPVQVVPGVSVVATAPDDTVTPALRLLAPGTRAAKASITLLGAAGEEPLPGATALTLPAGVVTDVPLTGLAAGAYTVVVRANVPVLAAALVTRPGARAAQGGGTMFDRAWAPSTTVGRSGVVAVPRAADGTLVVSGVGDATTVGSSDATASGTLRVLGVDGTVLATRSVRVGAGATGAWSLADLVAGSSDLVASPPAADDTAADDSASAADDGSDDGGIADAPPVDVGSGQSYFPPDGTATPDQASKPAVTGPSAIGKVAGLDLVVPDGGEVRLAWAFVADVDQADGQLVSVLSAVPVAGEPPAVAVQRESRAGIR